MADETNPPVGQRTADRIPEAPPGQAFDANDPGPSRRPPAGPERDAGGRLTHRGMRQVLAEGGSVLHHGRIIDRHEDLPSEADLAGADEKRRAQVRHALHDQIARLSGELAKVEGPQPEQPVMATADAGADERAEQERRQWEQGQLGAQRQRNEADVRRQQEEARQRQEQAQRQEAERAEQQRQEAERAEAERQKRKGK